MQQGRRSAKPQVIVFMVALVAIFVLLYSDKLFNALSPFPSSNAQSTLVEQSLTTNEFIRQEAQLREQIRTDPENATHYRALGQLYLQVNRFDRALGAFNDALARDASSAVAYLRRGLAYAGLGDLSNASADYERTLSLESGLSATVSREYVALSHRTQNPTFAIAYLTRALDLAPTIDIFTERGHVHAALGDLVNAAADYENALRLADDTQLYGAYFYNLGQLAESAHLYQEAITYFDRAIALNNEEATYFYMRARVYDLLEQAQNAMSDYEYAITLSDDLQPTILRDLASRAYEQANFSQAITFYTRLIDLTPDDLFPYRQRAVSYHRMGDNVAAFGDLNMIIERFPDNPQVYRDVAWMSVQVENYDQALRFYNLAYELDPDNLDTYRQIGRTHLSLGQTGQALNVFTQIAQRQPDDPQSYRDLGFMYQAIGDDARAQNAFAQVLSYNGATVQDYDALATLFVNTGQWQSAIDVYSQGLALSPQNVMLRRKIAWTHAQIGEIARARAHYDIALGLAPDDPQTSRELAHLYQQIGERETARVTYERVIEIAPDDPQSHDDMGQFLVSIGQVAEALPYFATALERDFTSSQVSGGLYGVVERRAEAYFLLGDLSNTISNYEYLLASDVVVNARLAEVYALRGANYRQTNREDLAIADFERAFALMPDQISYRDAVVNLRYLRGTDAYNTANYDLAIADFERLAMLGVQLNNADINTLRYSAYYLRAQSREGVGLYTLALEDYARASEHPAYAPSALLHSGDLHYRLGQHEESLQAYRTYFQLTGGAPSP